MPPVGAGDAREPDAKDANAPYSFNDPAKEQTDVEPPLDSPLAQPVGPTNPPKVDPAPTQVVRRRPINPETMAMNRAYWSLPEVRGTVWAHYMLVATQWPTVTQPPTPDNDGRYFPGPRIDPNTPGEPYQVDETKDEPEENLANVTMETYAQDAPVELHVLPPRRLQRARPRLRRDSARRRLTTLRATRRHFALSSTLTPTIT